MSLTVIQRPNQNGVWIAAKNPVIYKMTRKDYTWTLLVTSAGDTSIRIATDVTASFVAGDTIWLEADDGAYSATGSVVSSAYGTYTTVVTDIPFVANNAAGYINTTTQRLNYYVGIDVYKSVDNTLIGTVNYYPTKKGLLTIDISQPLQSVLDPSIAAISNGIIYQDTNITEGFYIKYTEFWTGSANPATIDLQVQFSNSTFQTSLSPWLQTGDIFSQESWTWISNAVIKSDATSSGYRDSNYLYQVNPSGNNWPIGTYTIHFIGDNSAIGPDNGTLLCKIYGSNDSLLNISLLATSSNIATGAFAIDITFTTTIAQQIFIIEFYIGAPGNKTVTTLNSVVMTTMPADTIYSIYGAKQIGSDAYYSSYVNGLLVTLLDSLQLASGEYFSLSYISSSGGVYDWIKKSYYNAAGILLFSTYIKSTNNTHTYSTLNPPSADFTSVPSSIYTLFQKLDFTDAILPDRNIANAGTITWLGNSLLIGTGTTSKTWCAPFFLAQNSSVSFSFSFTLTGNATNVTPHLYLFNSSGTVLSGSVNIFTGSNGIYTGTGSITNSGASDAYFIGFDFTNASGADKTLQLNSLLINIPSSAIRIDFKGIRLSISTTYTEIATLFTTIIGNIISCTKNPITLMWRNSLGGESSWTFNFNQEIVQKLQDPYKNKQYTLFDQNLTLTQFNALNELFTLGQIYQTPLIELTTSIDKTEARIGQQVYIIDSNGNKTGVIVLSGENKTMTKRNKHTLQATIELPEIFG